MHLFLNIKPSCKCIKMLSCFNHRGHKNYSTNGPVTLLPCGRINRYLKAGSLPCPDYSMYGPGADFTKGLKSMKLLSQWA